MSTLSEKLKHMDYHPIDPVALVNSNFIEELLKISEGEIPADYYEFLCEFPRGGTFPSAVARLCNNINDDHFYVDFLYANDEGPLDIVKVQRQFQYVLSNMLLIGSDPGGNQICIGTGKGNFGKIFFWDHEEDPREKLYPVADSFTAFVLE